MDLNEIFKANGVGDDAISKIAAAMKENKIYTTAEENMDVRYGKLKTDHEGTVKQLGEANTLIEELKKSNKGNEGLQAKISNYETQVQQLQVELQQTKLDAAIKVALLSEKAQDVDYLTFKLKEKGELALDENDKIKGWDDKIAGLKTQFPNQFESAGAKKIEEHKLEQGENKNNLSRDSVLKMSYAERSKLFQENPEGYEAAMKSN